MNSLLHLFGTVFQNHITKGQPYQQNTRPFREVQKWYFISCTYIQLNSLLMLIIPWYCNIYLQMLTSIYIFKPCILTQLYVCGVKSCSMYIYFPVGPVPAMRRPSAARSDAPNSANPYHAITPIPKRPATMLKVRATIPRAVNLRKILAFDSGKHD